MKNSPLPILQSLNIDNKRSVQDLMAIIAASGPDVLPAAVERAYGKTGEWRGSHPLNEMCGAEYITKTVWQPLKISFPDLERRDEIIVGGRYRDRHGEVRDQVACMGHYCGTFKQDWLDIPATGQPLFMRYGEVHEVSNGQIVRSSCLWDILDVIRQAGFWPLAPSWGTEGRWMGPSTLR